MLPARVFSPRFIAGGTHIALVRFRIPDTSELHIFRNSMKTLRLRFRNGMSRELLRILFWFLQSSRFVGNCKSFVLSSVIVVPIYTNDVYAIAA